MCLVLGYVFIIHDEDQISAVLLCGLIVNIRTDEKGSLLLKLTHIVMLTSMKVNHFCFSDIGIFRTQLWNI